jgi:hypothetical protein
VFYSVPLRTFCVPFCSFQFFSALAHFGACPRMYGVTHAVRTLPECLEK